MKADLRRASSLLAHLQPTRRSERLLSGEQRLWLAEWRKRRPSCSATSSEECEAFYAASLSCSWTDRDPVRSDIAKVLDPLFERCRVLETDCAENAALKYQEYRLA